MSHTMRRTMGGYRALLMDGDTDIVEGGEASFDEAQRTALSYLHERLRHANDGNVERLANLRLALLRVEAAKPKR